MERYRIVLLIAALGLSFWLMISGMGCAEQLPGRQATHAEWLARCLEDCAERYPRLGPDYDQCVDECYEEPEPNDERA